jgi:hypothetical protein
MNSLFKMDLNYCICIYNYDLNKKSDKRKYHLKPLMHYSNTTVNTKGTKFQYILFIYTFDEYIVINFEKNEKLRLVWYNLFEKLCNNLNKKIIIHQIDLKIKDLNDRNIEPPLMQSTHKGYTDSRLCFVNDKDIYLINSNFKLIYEKLLTSSSSSLNDHHEEISNRNYVKFNINHIKRIGHDKSNRFFIELGKRSVYGKWVFIFKCLNYDLACFLHRKTSQFIDKDPSIKKMQILENKKNNSKIRRYYKIFSQNSTKFKDQLSCVLKKLSWSKLSNSSEKLSKFNNDDVDDHALVSSKSFNFGCKCLNFAFI